MSNLFDSISETACSSDSLDRFLNEKMQSISDFYNSDYSYIGTCKGSIDDFILLRDKQIAQLDYTKSYNKSFILMLLDYCERFNLQAATPRICSILNSNSIATNSRQQAALLFLYPKPKTNSELVDKFDCICEKLQLAIETEEDDDSKALATFLNYFGIVINDTNVLYAKHLKRKTIDAVDNKTYPFLRHNCINEIIKLDLNNAGNSYAKVQNYIDEILHKVNITSLKTIIIGDNILIENDTKYAKALSVTPAKFDSIRNISVQHSDGEEYTNRGVKILTSESELLAYLSRFGNMHKAKMQSALEEPFPQVFTINFDIIDWGCGQGIASMVFLEKYGFTKIHSITLIEPSEIAIKRAALHCKKYCSNLSINTIAKKLDDLNICDFKAKQSDVTIHLFSNILDIDDYSQDKLISLIEKSQKGVNYFVCVSPYIDDIKTERLDSFKRYFENRYNSFELMLDVQNLKEENDIYWNCNENYKRCKCYYHRDNGCNKKWTRVLKVFRITIV